MVAQGAGGAAVQALHMEKLRFAPGDGGAADPDVRMLSDQDLEKAAAEGKGRE